MTDSGDFLPDGRPQPPHEEAQNVIHIKDYQTAGVAYGAVRVYSEADAQSAPPRDYFIKGLISPKEMSVAYGEPGCGKTFWVLYTVRAVARGHKILGRRVRQTNVLYGALEGVSGFEKRLRADILANEECEGFFYIAQPLNLFNDARNVSDVIAAIQACGAGIFVVDTLNRAMPGGSENAPEDMGQFIKNMDAIRAATDAHIIIVHHSGKDVSRGMRGHSALLGATDLALEISKDTDGKRRFVKVIKAKDDSDGDVFAFHLEVKVLGKDSDGDDITTCVVHEDGALKPQPKKEKSKGEMKPEEQLWFDTWQELFAREENVKVMSPERGMKSVPCVHRDTLREWTKARGLVGATHEVAKPGVLTTGDRKAFGRMLSALKIKKKVGIHGNWIWLIVTPVT